MLTNFQLKSKHFYMSESFNFKKWNTLLGWAAFAIALLTYSLTVEPTLSFWDCGEYIATAAKLEVGHPPGAPLFQMLGAFFALFAPSANYVALMVNLLSVFSSAFTILFMFWSLTLLFKKLFTTHNEWTTVKIKVALGASFIASLAYTFTDSFWFNAVEAEVYAMASFLIAVLFWMGLRWEEDMFSARGNRWLLAISLLVGLSFGVHFMALLTIPAIGFLYYFKKYITVTAKNFIAANVIIVAVLLFIFKLLLPYTLAFFGKTEIFMVNQLGLPFNSGTLFAAIVIVLLFVFGLKYTHKNEKQNLNTLLLCVLFVLIGFSTWIMLPVRANANVVINENKPSDAAEVLAYYNREQYGEQKLFYGPQYTDAFAGLDENNPYLDDKPNYERDYTTNTYKIVNNYKNAKQNSSDAHKAILPRLWSGDHIENYINFTSPSAFVINPTAFEDENGTIDEDQLNAFSGAVADFKKSFAAGKIGTGDYVSFLKKYSNFIIVEKPGFFENIAFMVEFQFGYMYWRYLMWNFTGKQNDEQGYYDDENGNWLSGISFIDNLHLGDQTHLPDDALQNKGRNTYYFIPFFLGILGIMYLAKKDWKLFYVLLVLFLFMGFALKIYLNERPFEPRERDYALVGSFMVFAMWIAFGIYALYEAITEYLKPKWALPITLAACFLGAPVLLATENWDDHDRSEKYTALAMAKAYLASCDKNAILFTIGDNDTFPLWYAQEIEGFRTDVRIVCTSLFNTDWYIDQMKRKAYDSDPLPIRFSHNDYISGNRDFMIFEKLTEERILLEQFINFIATNGDDRTLIELRNGHKVHFYPTNKVRIPVDKAAVLKHNVVNPTLKDSIVPYIDIDIQGSALYKNRLMMLDVIANNNWKRPIYFTGGSFGDDDFLWMKDYLQMDGLVYRLLPIKTPVAEDASVLDMGRIDSEKLFKIVTAWDWGNSGSNKIYHDPVTRKNAINYRATLIRLVQTLIEENKWNKAEQIADLAMKNMPIAHFGFYATVEPFAEAYYLIGKKQKAQKVVADLLVKYKDNLDYYKTLSSTTQNKKYMDIATDLETYRRLIRLAKDNDDIGFYLKEKKNFNAYNNLFKAFERPME